MNDEKYMTDKDKITKICDNQRNVIGLTSILGMLMTTVGLKPKLRYMRIG